MAVSSSSEGGGFYSTRKVNYSKETQELLKTMMNESKLSSLQQRKINHEIKRGGGLPVVKKEKTPTRVHKHSHHTRTNNGIRTLETIQQLEAKTNNSITDNITVSTYNSSVEKERLHNIMAFGKSQVNNTQPIVTISDQQNEEEIDRFEEVLKEIEERKEFLKDMSSLGMEHVYHSQLTSEISQKIRELEMMEKQQKQQKQ